MSSTPRLETIHPPNSADDESGVRAHAAPVPGPAAIQRVIGAYRDPIVRGYSWGRFKIFRQRFLQEIGQYLPSQGRVLDVGCGFGLFALYYAQTNPAVSVHGFDLNRNRIDMAQAAARRLGVANAHFHVEDAANLRAQARFDAVYMLDIIHHIPKDAVEPLLAEVYETLPAGGVLLVKDLDTTPAWQRLFAHALDLAMTPSAPPHYWSTHHLKSLLTRVGFDVKLHAMVDILPYPHVLYVARKR